MIVKKRDAYFISMIFLIAPIASIHTNFYNDRYDSLAFIATVATTVAVSKLAYDWVSFFDSNQLPALYNKLFSKQPLPSVINVGYLDISGDIDNVADYVTKISFYKEDPLVQGLLIHINSGGGNPGSAELLHRELRSFGKPIVAFFDQHCFSGAYLVATAADHIIASSVAEVGSIGVLSTHKYFSEEPKLRWDNEEGKAKTEVVVAGAYKNGWNLYEPFSDIVRTKQQEIINRTYDFFCSAVADARELSLDTRDIWADGNWFLVPEAIEIGLIDSCGSWTDAQNVLLALIKQKNPNAVGPLKIINLQV